MQIAEKFQKFYCEDQKDHWDGVFLTDGTRLEEKALHPVAIIAVNAESALAADGTYAKQCVDKFWNTPLRTGERRYYDNFCICLRCLLYREITGSIRNDD